jgi:SAM-dependent methyltransferase
MSEPALGTSDGTERIPSTDIGRSARDGDKLRCLDIGCGKAKRAGCVGLDRYSLPGVDVVHDMKVVPWPFPDRSFDVVYANHVLEHLPDLIQTMEEIHRILRRGGRLFVRVPHYRAPGAFQDPTHVRFFTERTFEYFTPDGTTSLSPLNYYSKARFLIEDLEYGWRGPLSWHVDRYVRSRLLRRALHRMLLHRKGELRLTLLAVK